MASDFSMTFQKDSIYNIEHPLNNTHAEHIKKYTPKVRLNFWGADQFEVIFFYFKYFFMYYSALVVGKCNISLAVPKLPALTVNSKTVVMTPSSNVPVPAT